MSALRKSTESSVEEREWLTLVDRKLVLVVVHTLTYGKRLVEVLSLLEADFRVQVVFTAPPHVFGDEVPASSKGWEARCCRGTRRCGCGSTWLSPPVRGASRRSPGR